MEQHMQWAVETIDLVRTFKRKGKPDLRALDSVNLTVSEGEIFGLLGPNGAGKTTLIKILVTLLYPTAGKALVAGYDVMKNAEKIRPLITMVSGGETSGYGILTVFENIWIFSQFYGIPSAEAKRRILYWLERFELADQATTRVNRISTGMRQKMNLVRGFVTDPAILFLDEPTLGLDVHVAIEVRKAIREWVSGKPGRTVFLTTHYMAEAEYMCNRVAIIDKGSLVVCDTPINLRQSLDMEGSFILTLAPAPAQNPDFEKLQDVKSSALIKKAPDNSSATYEIFLEHESAISLVLSEVSRLGLTILELAKKEPSLEELFLKIVGRRLEHDE
jgi:ABC-2 type transport system ATP-binding protein